MELQSISPNTVRMQHKGVHRRPTFLREWRHNAGFKLADAAERLGFRDHTQLSKIERGVSKYNQELLENAAELYGCTEVDLLARAPGEKPDIFTIWPRLTAEQKNYAEEMLLGITRVHKRPQ
jgi:transcriptional regulator with XRE-family HTH domain